MQLPCFSWFFFNPFVLLGDITYRNLIASNKLLLNGTRDCFRFFAWSFDVNVGGVGLFSKNGESFEC
jgi:hypothetical protein